MNIDGSQDFAGCPLIQVRDTLKRLNRLPSGCFGRDEFHWDYKGPADAEAAVFDELVRLHYIEPLPADDFSYQTRGPVWELTPAGGSLANASAARPIRRKTADHVLAGFLDRIDEIEQDPRCLVVVDQAVLFGSMLDPDRDPVSDVDVAVTLVRHPERTAAAPTDAFTKIFHRFMGWTRAPEDKIEFFGEHDAWKRLKSRKSSLSLHRLDEETGAIGGLPDVRHRFLYRRGEGRLY